MRKVGFSSSQVFEEYLQLVIAREISANSNQNGIVWRFLLATFGAVEKIILHYSPPRMMTAKMMTAIAMIVW